MIDKHIIPNIAVYIDGDNARYKDFSYVYEEIKKNGRIIIGRIYGDWTKSEMRGWKDITVNYALESINNFSLSKKNSTDIHLICDILKDLYKNQNIDIYIIVSSDSDFTHVAKTIRMEGKKFIGIGHKNTSTMLKNACDIFISTENIKNDNNILDNNEDNSEDNSDDEEDNIVLKKIYNFNNYDEELQYIIKSFKNNKKIFISKLKKNLSLLCDTRNIYTSDEYRYFDKYLINKFPNDFRIIENNKSIIILNITNLLENIYDIFDNLDKENFNLSLIKDKLLLKDSSFDQRSYGFTSMRDFIEKIFPNNFEMIIQENNTVYIKKCNSIL